jgi:RpiR family transcriptional regulator, carbohydrate utilization regulator
MRNSKMQGEAPHDKHRDTGKVAGVLARLEGILPSLGPKATRIAEFILRRPEDVIHMSVTEVAELVESSEGSVVGLCQRIGLAGFQQLKIGVATDLVQPVQFIHEDLKQTDTPTEVVAKITHSNIQALYDTQSIIDVAELERATTAISTAGRVEVYGIGSAAPIAEDAHYRMLRIGLNSKVEIDSHRQAISASLTGPDVATLTISHSGSTRETIDATRLAKEAGATTIGISNYGRSPIQAYTDIILYTMAKETRFRTEAMTSRIAQLCIVDILIACLALRNYETTVATIKRTFDTLSLKRF